MKKQNNERCVCDACGAMAMSHPDKPHRKCPERDDKTPRGKWRPHSGSDPEFKDTN